MRRFHLPLVLFITLAALLTCRSPLGAQTGPNPPGASVAVKVQVPTSMRSAPFNVDRALNVPPRFTPSVYARVPGARFLAVAPNGDVLVSQPSLGKVSLVRPGVNGGDPRVSDFVTGLRLPHDIVFHAVGGVSYVYISESHQINRYLYNAGDLTAHDRQVVVSGLPDASSPELHGAYGHQLKNIALDGNDKLYVCISSATNADPADQAATPVRGAVYQYNADGTGGRLFARGLRNAEGLAFVPGTGDLWACVNNRDQIAYPYNDASGLYGQVVPAYVDNHPPEEFTRVRDGGNYGWPFASPNPDTASGPNDMPFDPDFQNNKDGSLYPVGGFDRINKGIQAHSAPLGLLFLQDTAAPDAYKQGAVLALHGSWNRTTKTGYKVIYFPWNAQTQTPGDQIDLVTGWLDDASQTAWGRPVDTAVSPQGDMLVSDDQSGTIYKLSYQVNPAPVVSGLSPATVVAGGPAFRLSVVGTGFVDGSVVAWNGVALATTFGTQTALTASVPAAFVSAAGAANVAVVSPPPGGGTSGALPFVVTAPPPVDAPVSLASLAVDPASVIATAGATGTVTLSVPAPTEGLAVSLASSSPVASAPATVTVPAGATTATFTIGTTTVAAPTTVTLTASLNGSSQSASLTVAPAPGTVLGAGLRLISLPFDYPGTSPDALFGLSGVMMAVWSPSSLQYAVTPTAPANDLRLGRGYWIRLPSDAKVSALGAPADPAKDFEIGLERGWNQIGQPFPAATALSALKVRAGAQTLAFSDAVSANVVSGTVYGFTPGTPGAYAALDTLASGQGAWLYAFAPTTLVFPHP